MIKITQSELAEHYTIGRTMIWQFNTLYQVNYSINAGYYLTLVRRNIGRSQGVTRRGRYVALTPATASQF